MVPAAGTDNPWITIWTSPRTTIRRVVDADPHYKVLFLAILWGALSRLELRWSQVPGAGAARAAWPLLVVASVIVGAITGVIGLYVSGAVFKWSGRALGGSATYAEVRAALAWSEVPAITALAIGILSILAGAGGPALMADASSANSSETMSMLHMVLAAWSFVLTVKCLAEVHRFSAWRSLGSILIPAAMVLILALISLSVAGAYPSSLVSWKSV